MAAQAALQEPERWHCLCRVRFSARAAADASGHRKIALTTTCLDLISDISQRRFAQRRQLQACSASYCPQYNKTLLNSSSTRGLLVRTPRVSHNHHIYIPVFFIFDSGRLSRVEANRPQMGRPSPMPGQTHTLSNCFEVASVAPVQELLPNAAEAPAPVMPMAQLALKPGCGAAEHIGCPKRPCRLVLCFYP